MTPASSCKRVSCLTTACCVLVSVVILAAETKGTDVLQISPFPRQADASALCVRGDSFFRNADFGSAKLRYEAAIRLDPASARACLGLGRVARVEFRRRAARGYFETAFKLDPSDPEILFSYSDYASDPYVRGALCAALRNHTSSEDSRILHVIATLRISQGVASRVLNRLDGPYHLYRLKLFPFLPVNSTPYGLVLKASLNGGKPLRLVLDTGAKGVIVSSKAARNLALEVIAESGISGLGAGKSKNATVALARSFESGDFKIENCVVEVTKDSVVAGADGIIGTDLFQQFVIHLDPRSYTLELMPFSGDRAEAKGRTDPWLEFDASPPDSHQGSVTVFHIGHLLATKAAIGIAIGERVNGLFVLDTGSAFTIASPELVNSRPLSINTVALRGAQGHVAASSGTLELRVAGGPVINDGNVVAMDLTGMGAQEGAKISGLLGYSALSRYALTLNYREGLIELAPHEPFSKRTD